ncbi:alpha/beta fold hydrolase [Longivirga aurantiaca]|uniref:Alpha/beta fold hydrolase n=1 Tax=Longivirga aurantiaca TaxID=1837743 RepID=A0ABW1SZX4_9ACTN
MTYDETASTLTLADGRELDLRRRGPSGGDVLVYIHGTPSSAAAPSALAEAAHARGLQLVSWSRPGYSTSTRQPGRSIASFATDAREVLDRLGIDRVHALGWSGGGPHVLSLAALLPDRIRSATSLAGVAPYAETSGELEFLAGMGRDNIEEFGAAVEGEEPLRQFLAPFVPALRVVTPAGIVEELASLLPDVDRAYCTDEHGGELAQAFHEALVVSEDGWVDDDLAFVRPWGFDLASIRVPVHVWQGSADLMVPFAHGVWLASAVPGAVAHLLDGDGHLSIAVGQAEAIVDALLASG